ncbi:PilZ domain-containing protein [Pseudomonas gingeri]|uniref:PilZ domain-containing protein n=1 Tax=Pseudomonas gingeri TaxID=117681 RepID=A0A7Y7Y838_9PSED|nr:PilZ domain-containing protein [Pseudomonas gingeri]NVZ99814.1 PilZ domain-containing protein [Pseudomonas gingeri]NWA16654.1 PilZ domain-containing protein [Pseudomonas gingeri]NWA53960.1 PilZ domain-containing protein [Pseudomonas gingeri]NWA94192.1 PilZ domain-containing protein [Pseudomonas gingeri]NWB01908.1 PilZ domain-containing protein [Pseudomonas gingeri]
MVRFLPHPVDVPVKLTLLEHSCISRHRLRTLSLGGIACPSPRAWRHGSALEMCIPSLGEAACYSGYVAWCLKRKHAFLVGIAFVDEQTLFGARMSEQLCQIERYRKVREQQNAQPQNIEAIAQEWVQQHANDFSHASLEQPFIRALLD